MRVCRWLPLVVLGLAAQGCGSGAAGANGKAGVSTLIRSGDEAPGKRCQYGGKLFDVGPDANGDGTLSDDEVQTTEVVCNGAPGDAGPAGGTALMNAVDEPPGANCGTGGTKYTYGVDRNDNGVLDDDEVQGTQYVCNGAPGSGKNSLVSVTAEPAGTNCAGGGQAVHSGVDDNDDGILESSEVTSTVYVCDGTNGSTSLVREEDEPPGTNCPYGGIAVLSGLDTDNSGFLEASEVVATSYVCDGKDGTNGKDAVSSLVSITKEPKGKNCIVGGQRIDVGLDKDGSGTLDKGEITNTTYVCNGTNGQDGQDGTAFVMKATQATWGGVCTYGGERIATGVDSNGNGVLDTSEVTDVQYVCNVVPSSLAIGGSQLCVVMSDSSLRCLGKNDQGQLGLGNTTDHILVVANPEYGSGPGQKPVTAVAAGSKHTCVLLATGHVECFGDNSRGQLGDGTKTDRHSPVTVPGLSNVTDIAAAGGVTCAISGGHAYCWGQNNHGQIGNGSTTDRTSPYMLGLINVTQIAPGPSHTCALVSTGQAFCWGYNYYGQLGDNSTTQRLTPVAVSGMSTATSISTGAIHTCAIKNNSGTLRIYCWGDNDFYQLADGTQTASHVPQLVPGLSPTSVVQVGGNYSCLQATGSSGVACWGSGDAGQLATYPESVGLDGLAGLDAGPVAACAIRDNQEVYCWGQDGGQLGIGITKSSTTPVKVSLAPGS